MKRKYKFSLLVVIEYLLVITIILNCNSVYAASIKDFHLNEIAALLAVILAVVGIKKGGTNKRLLNKWAGLFAIYYVLMIAFMIVSVPGESMLGFISRFMIFIPIMAFYLAFLSKKSQQNRLLSEFINVMVFLSVLSVFFWFFGSYLHMIHPNMSIQAHWGRDHTYPGYFGLYFEGQSLNLFSYSGYRNDGIFTEGPMYSFCLIISLASLFLIEEYSVNGKLKRDSKRKALVLIIALLTVMSFSGYVLLVGIFFLRFVTTTTRNRTSREFRIIISLFVIVVGGLIVVAMLAEKQQTSSWLIRLDDIQAGIKAWLAAPVFGNGYGTYAVEEYMSSFRWWNTGFSSAILSILSQGGLVLFSAYLMAFILGLKSALKVKDKSMGTFIIVVVIELIVTTVHFTFLVLFLLSYCYMLWIKTMKAKSHIV